MKNCLIICTGNSCRSQMAEGICRELYENDWNVYSAGTHPSTVNQYAIEVMKELNIDISHHTSDSISKYLQKPIDRVITVCGHADQNCPNFPGSVERLHWPFDDPFNLIGSNDEILDGFRKVRDIIHNKFINDFKV